MAAVLLKYVSHILVILSPVDTLWSQLISAVFMNTLGTWDQGVVVVSYSVARLLNMVIVGFSRSGSLSGPDHAWECESAGFRHVEVACLFSCSSPDFQRHVRIVTSTGRASFIYILHGNSSSIFNSTCWNLRRILLPRKRSRNSKSQKEFSDMFTHTRNYTLTPTSIPLVRTQFPLGCVTSRLDLEVLFSSTTQWIRISHSSVLLPKPVLTIWPWVLPSKSKLSKVKTMQGGSASGSRVAHFINMLSLYYNLWYFVFHFYRTIGDINCHASQEHGW